MNKQALFFGVAIMIVLILLILLVAVNRTAPATSLLDERQWLSSSQALQPFIKKALPEFRLYESMTSREVSRADIIGEKMLLNVWATWCVACRQEHDVLNHLSAQGIRIVGLNYRDKLPLVEEWFTKLGNPYVANLFDNKGKLGQLFPVIGAPETYFINRDGVIIHKHAGVLEQQHWDASLSHIYNAME